MIRLFRAADRGRSQWGWLDSRHSFSFGEYHDPARMGFRTLRVVNDDRVAPGEGFGTHGHRDMEILTFVVDGSIAHRDSEGHESVLHAGGVQRMSAGTGIMHSEYNASRTKPLRFLQVWILPERRGIDPGYEDLKHGSGEHAVSGAPGVDAFREGLLLAASRDGRDGSLTIHQDADVYTGRLVPGASILHELRPGSGAFLQVMTGALELNATPMSDGDHAEIEDGTTLKLTSRDGAQFLLFDLG
jgi:hypothetical protein